MSHLEVGLKAIALFSALGGTAFLCTKAKKVYDNLNNRVESLENEMQQANDDNVELENEVEQLKDELQSKEKPSDNKKVTQGEPKDNVIVHIKNE